MLSPASPSTHEALRAIFPHGDGRQTPPPSPPSDRRGWVDELPPDDPAAAGDFAALPPGPRQRLVAFLMACPPVEVYPAPIREDIAGYQSHLRELLAPADHPRSADWQDFQTLSLFMALMSYFMRHEPEAERLQRKADHCRGRSGARASAAQREAQLQGEGLLALRAYIGMALHACMPALAETLLGLEEPDLAGHALSTLALIEARQQAADPTLQDSEMRAILNLFHAIWPVVRRMSDPPTLPPVPVEDPVETARALQQGDASPPIHFQKLAWLNEVVDLVASYCLDKAALRCLGWVETSLRGIEKVLRELCEHENSLEDRQEPEGVRKALAPVRQQLLRIGMPALGPGARESLRQSLSLFCQWINLVYRLGNWLGERRPQDPARRRAQASASPPLVRVARVRQKQRAPQAVSDEAPGGALIETDTPPAQAVPVVRRPQRLALAIAPPARSAAARPSPASGPLRAAAALPLLQRASLGDPAEALACLHGFLGGRRLRPLLRAETAELASALLRAMTAVVQSCDEASPRLSLSAVRELLDAAWTAADRPAGAALADAGYRHFCAGQTARQSSGGLRLFCLTRGLDRFFQALPAAPLETGLAALQALEQRLQGLEQEDEATRQRGELGLARHFQQSLRQARLDYMRAYTKLSEEERQASADDMRAWLASALHSIAPYARAAEVQDLARQLARLAGVAWPASLRPADPPAMRQAAIRLLTDGRSAACRRQPAQRFARINAHNLGTPVFEPLLVHLAAQRTASGSAAFDAFELLLGNRHDQDGARAEDRKWSAVARWAATLDGRWHFQHEGAAQLYAHRGRRPRAGWATWTPAAPSS
ncbi:hypothetical protein GT347_04755 [Xylophilus rhododendri]|uniref:Uncharacterized protein n=1 Tax=Xylophilus rhododendri TaxID=2697032 RepID=A0A857J2S3_9BURK|nr:hypothetical protein [Xylophilus rhododendri]QHI97351.1 hypothetical protein GT347_04755 [Xylophilus rhododendri]